LALGFAGLLFLVGPGTGVSAGLLVLMLSALAWASGSILSRRRPAPGSLVMTSGMQLLAGGVALVLVGLALGEAARVDAHVLAPRALWGFAYMVLVSSLIGFTAFTWLLRVAPPTLVGTYAFVNPVVALLVGWAFGGEGLSAATLASTVVIVAGVALIVTGGRNGSKGGAYDRSRVEGHDPGRAGGRVPGLLEAHRAAPLPGHSR
jgi:drug/metabolite transporter (DMT)-like permease